jgi:hypothetical protein
MSTFEEVATTNSVKKLKILIYRIHGHGASNFLCRWRFIGLRVEVAEIEENSRLASY